MAHSKVTVAWEMVHSPVPACASKITRAKTDWRLVGDNGVRLEGVAPPSASLPLRPATANFFAGSDNDNPIRFPSF